MAFANRGKYAEDKVHEYLQWWSKDDTHREANRLVDTKSAGRVIKASKADFDYYSDCRGRRDHGLIEAKQTEHEYRIARDKVPQLPAMRKRDKCGGISYVLVYHTTIKAWRAPTVDYMANNGDKGSWDLRAMPTFGTCWEALGSLNIDLFPEWVK
jgi:penicillin-binding protein-related factor A (putative recombinase)